MPKELQPKMGVNTHDHLNAISNRVTPQEGEISFAEWVELTSYTPQDACMTGRSDDEGEDNITQCGRLSELIVDLRNEQGGNDVMSGILVEQIKGGIVRLLQANYIDCGDCLNPKCSKRDPKTSVEEVEARAKRQVKPI
ncbi:hypothetical protein ACFL2V_11210 [Pseudomonadota bacterium]